MSNAKLSRNLGATIHNVFWDGDRNRSCEALSVTLRGQGKMPFVVPYGASNALGAIAYACVAAEISEQSQAAGFQPAAILAPSVSGATQAGLCLGAAMEMPSSRVVGIDISFKPELVRAKVDSLAKRAAQKRPEQNVVALSTDEVKNYLYNVCKCKWNEVYQECEKGWQYKTLRPTIHTKLPQLPSRRYNTIIFRLRSGHCRLNQHLNRIGSASSPLFPRCGTPESVEHYIINCPL